MCVASTDLGLGRKRRAALEDGAQERGNVSVLLLKQQVYNIFLNYDLFLQLSRNVKKVFLRCLWGWGLKRR